MAKAFYQYNDSVPADYAFTNETFNTAVRRYGGDDEIYLPEGCVHKKIKSHKMIQFLILAQIWQTFIGSLLESALVLYY